MKTNENAAWRNFAFDVYFSDPHPDKLTWF